MQPAYAIIIYSYKHKFNSYVYVKPPNL